MHSLELLGWNASWRDAFDALSLNNTVPARVCAEHRELYTVHRGDGELPARVRGSLQWRTERPDAWPAVGDWVAVTLHDNDTAARIEAVLPRRTALRRKVAADSVVEAQIVASNVDTVFVITSLNRDFNPRRIERALALVWESGASPVLVLSKADLCTDDEEREACLTAAHDIALGVPIHAISALSGDGLARLNSYLTPGHTIALLGTSGVGKSTLTNALLGEDRQKVQEIRADAYRGSHTTTGRHLLLLPDGACLVDTPGIRTVGLWDADEGLAEAFRDIESLAKECRFRDCTHKGEPGCRVAEEIDDARLSAYHKLQREMQFLQAKDDKSAMANRKRRWKAMTKANRQANRDR